MAVDRRITYPWYGGRRGEREGPGTGTPSTSRAGRMCWADCRAGESGLGRVGDFRDARSPPMCRRRRGGDRVCGHGRGSSPRVARLVGQRLGEGLARSGLASAPRPTRGQPHGGPVRPAGRGAQWWRKNVVHPGGRGPLSHDIARRDRPRTRGDAGDVLRRSARGLVRCPLPGSSVETGVVCVVCRWCRPRTRRFPGGPRGARSCDVGIRGIAHARRHLHAVGRSLGCGRVSRAISAPFRRRNWLPICSR